MPAFARKLGLALRGLDPAARYLVGVSGGRDSVALLHGLLEAGFRRLVVAHLDHGLRGRASRADAEFVRKLTAKLDLPFARAAVDVAALAREGKVSIETAAREARYTFFAATARRRRCAAVFLAHHADDQVETFFFNLLRGGGPAGLGGMANDSSRRVGRGELRILRPLLGTWRSEIDDELKGNALRWREDATNADPAHGTRNRLRAEVIPLLERVMGRDVRGAVWRTAEILREDEAWLGQVLAAAGPPPEQLTVKTLAAMPVAKQRRTVRAWLAAQGVADVGFDEVEIVRGLLDVNEGPAKVNLPGGIHARRRGGTVFLERPAGG